MVMRRHPSGGTAVATAVVLVVVWLCVAAAVGVRAGDSNAPLLEPPADPAATALPLGQSVELGPVVVHADGSLGRLSNWAALTAHERVRMLASVQARNRVRRARLEQQRDDDQL